MTYKTFLYFLVLFSLILFGCEESVENSDTGRLSVKLMDAPFPIDLVSEANVKIYLILR